MTPDLIDSNFNTVYRLQIVSRNIYYEAMVKSVAVKQLSEPIIPVVNTHHEWHCIYIYGCHLYGFIKCENVPLKLISSISALADVSHVFTLMHSSCVCPSSACNLTPAVFQSTPRAVTASFWLIADIDVHSLWFCLFYAITVCVPKHIFILAIIFPLPLDIRCWFIASERPLIAF